MTNTESKPKLMTPRRFLIRWTLTHFTAMLLLAIPTYIATILLALFVLLLHGAITYIYPFAVFAIQEVLMRRFLGSGKSHFWKWWWVSSSVLWFVAFFIGISLFPDQWYEMPDALFAPMLTWGLPLLVQTFRLQRHFSSGFLWLIAGLLAAAVHGWLVATLVEGFGPLINQIPFIILGVAIIQSLITGGALILIRRQQQRSTG